MNLGEWIGEEEIDVWNENAHNVTKLRNIKDEVYKREDGLYFSYKLGLKYNDKKNVNDF